MDQKRKREIIALVEERNADALKSAEHFNFEVYGKKPIFIALKNRDFETFKVIVDNPSTDLNLLLHAVIKKGLIEFVEYLLTSGKWLDLTRKNSEGMTPLHTAIKHGKLEIVKYLIDLIHEDFKIDALRFAVENNQIRIVGYLATKITNIDSSILELAVKKGYYQIVDLLMKFKVNVNIVTALKISVDNTDVETTVVLVKNLQGKLFSVHYRPFLLRLANKKDYNFFVRVFESLRPVMDELFLIRNSTELYKESYWNTFAYGNLKILFYILGFYRLPNLTAYNIMLKLVNDKYPAGSFDVINRIMQLHPNVMGDKSLDIVRLFLKILKTAFSPEFICPVIENFKHNEDVINFRSPNETEEPFYFINDVRIIRCLIDNGFSYTAAYDDKNVPPICYQLKKGNYQIFLYLAELGYEFRYLRDSTDLLRYIAEDLYIEEYMIRLSYLIKAGGGEKGLHYTILLYRDEPRLQANVESLILEYGYNPDEAIYPAAKIGNVELFKLVCDLGGDIQHIYQGKTPLYTAVKHKNFDLARYIVENDPVQADITTSGKKPIDLAVENDMSDFIDLLEPVTTDVTYEADGITGMNTLSKMLTGDLQSYNLKDRSYRSIYS